MPSSSNRYDTDNYDNRTYTGSERYNPEKPKLTVEKAIKKFFVATNMKPTKPIPVFYAWEDEKQPEFTDDGVPKRSFITVDYDKDKSEWYIGYIKRDLTSTHATIDDVTGTISLNNE